MTNEEIATRIKAGETALYNELWKQNKRIIYKLSNQFYRKSPAYCTRAGIEIDDLYQCGFVALIKAVQAYEPEKGYTFLTFLQYPLKRVFRDAIGINTGKKEPLNECASLDEPLDDEAGADTLHDITPDRENIFEYDKAEERIYNEELHNALEKALATLPDKESEIIKDRYYLGYSLKEIEDIKQIPAGNGRKLEKKAFNGLRKYKAMQYLKPFHDDYIKTKAYNNTGFSSWANYGSVEENIIERLEALESI